MTARVGAVLVAAGASRRMGFDKLWAALADRVVLMYSLEALTSSQHIGQIALVVASKRLSDARRLAATLGGSVVVCPGGTERRDSVAAGLDELDGCDWVVVHDAARPFLTAQLIERGLESARATGAAVAALPARDTMKRVANGTVLGTLPRQELWSVQTPQVFRFEVLREALRSSERDVTDEATLVERMGGQVRIFLGSEENWKITTPADLELAEAWLAIHSRAPAARPTGGEAHS